VCPTAASRPSAPAAAGEATDARRSASVADAHRRRNVDDDLRLAVDVLTAERSTPTALSTLKREMDSRASEPAINATIANRAGLKACATDITAGLKARATVVC
jgi:hypothetical protein